MKKTLIVSAVAAFALAGAAHACGDKNKTAAKATETTVASAETVTTEVAAAETTVTEGVVLASTETATVEAPAAVAEIEDVVVEVVEAAGS